MTKEQFKINKYGEVENIKGENIIKSFNFHNNSLGCVNVIVTEQPTDSNGENYFNIFIIDERFKKEYLNCLQEQIPKECVTDINKYFSEMWAEMEVLKKYLWFKYSTNEDTLSFNIEVF